MKTADTYGCVTVAPRCPRCGSTNTQTYRSQGIAAGVIHEGVRCRAQKQYRRCRECGEGFGVVHIKGPMPATKKRRGWVAATSNAERGA